jgi:CAAX protease family protein
MNVSRRTWSIVVFFVIAFGIPWGTWIALRRHVSFAQGPPLAFMLGGAFCSVAGIVATYIESGLPALRDLVHRCVLYRVSVLWWLYALFLALGIDVVATVIYSTAVRHPLGPVRPMELFHQWWFFYMFAFGLFQGPLAEELGWRGFLLPRLLGKHSPLTASLILGLIVSVWHINIFFSPISTIALFAASAVAVTILSTILFLHTRGSVLLAIVMHWSILPGRDLARISLPAAPEPPDWLRAVVVITVAALVVVTTGKQLTRSSIPG